MTIEEMKARKRELGLTNEKLAELSGVPIGTVQKIFSGETSSPRYNTIHKLEKVLHYSQSTLEYRSVVSDSLRVSESMSFGLEDYGDIKNQVTNKKSASQYIPSLCNKRIGISAGKYKVPDDSYFYDDEIAEMFEEV